MITNCSIPPNQFRRWHALNFDIPPLFLQDCVVKQNEVQSIRTQTERESLEKHKLEDAVMEKMMQRLTMDKATRYTQNSVTTVRKRSNELAS